MLSVTGGIPPVRLNIVGFVTLKGNGEKLDLFGVVIVH